jgi:hypothetical protein
MQIYLCIRRCHAKYRVQWFVLSMPGSISSGISSQAASHAPSPARHSASLRRLMRLATTRASLTSLPASSGSVMTGVLMRAAAVIRISLRRGIPSVTLASPRPAMWKVLRVIWVEGSPTDCAASTPTASPAATSERMYLSCISCSNSLASTEPGGQGSAGCVRC